MRSKEGRTQTLSRISSVTRSTFSAKNLAKGYQVEPTTSANGRERGRTSESGSLRGDRMVGGQVSTERTRGLLDTHIGS